MKRGRPTKYSDKIANELCEWLIEGKSLNSFCKKKNSPCISTVFNWLDSKPDFLEKYTRAKENQADTLADQILEIADEECNYTTVDDDGKTVTRSDAAKVNHQRLRVDARKWAASKLKPKKYGDRNVNENYNFNKDLPDDPEELERMKRDILGE